MIDDDLVNTIESGNLIEVIKLVERRADVNAVIGNNTPLGTACEYGHHHIVSYLISKGADLNYESDRGQPLYQAVRNGKIECVRVLLEAGANINIINDSQTLLNVVYDADILKLLTKAGLNINATDEKGRTELHNVIREYQKFMIIQLLENGIDIDAVDHNGQTALHYAVIYRHKINHADIDEVDLSIIDKLLIYNPNNTIRDNDGNLAIDYIPNDERELKELVNNYQYIDPELKEPDEMYST